MNLMVIDLDSQRMAMLPESDMDVVNAWLDEYEMLPKEDEHWVAEALAGLVEILANELGSDDEAE